MTTQMSPNKTSRATRSGLPVAASDGGYERGWLEDERGARVGQEVVDLGKGGPENDRYADGSELGYGEIDLHHGDAVQRQHRHPVVMVGRPGAAGQQRTCWCGFEIAADPFLPGPAVDERGALRVVMVVSRGRLPIPVSV